MTKRRGFLLVEGMVGFFLLFLASMTMFRLLSTSDRGYTLATQSRVALRLAREGLENVRAGNIPKTLGTQTLTTVSLKMAKSAMVFTPTITMSTLNSVLLVRSKVTWSEGIRLHSVEIKSCVAP